MLGCGTFLHRAWGGVAFLGLDLVVPPGASNQHLLLGSRVNLLPRGSTACHLQGLESMPWGGEAGSYIAEKPAWVGSNRKVQWFRMITEKLILFAPCAVLVSRTTKADFRGCFSLL